MEEVSGLLESTKLITYGMTLIEGPVHMALNVLRCLLFHIDLSRCAGPIYFQTYMASVRPAAVLGSLAVWF